jgi:beta-phosphoglucomutase-like phosphatase (HAD superfamily)
MVKLIIFDLDGVLVDAKEIHYESLNKALKQIDEKFVITREEHLTKYDGLTTKTKLNLLSIDKNLPSSSHDKIWEIKQSLTSGVIKEHLTEDTRLKDVLKQLKEDGYMVYVASNSIRETI